VLDPAIPAPTEGRTFAGRRRAGLADRDRDGRVRLDAIARILQDVAIDDVQETGWGMPSHLWFVRRIRIDVLDPFLDDREIELVTWCSGLAAIAAGRRWSLSGDHGGRAEVDSVWIHLGPDQKPARIEGFEIYAATSGGRHVSTKRELPDTPADATAAPWPLRATDVDVHGHVNNAIHWQAVEHALARSVIDPQRPLAAELEYREPLEPGDQVELLQASDGSALLIGLRTAATLKAVARVEPR
jgi:acyl-ACP thioesterase